MRKFVFSLFASLLLFAVSVNVVSAKVLTNENGTITIAKNEIINDDLFVTAQSVLIEGTINGDAFIGAQNVNISGIINGTLHVGAQTANLSGTVKNNVYIGAQDIFLSGVKVGGSFFAGGQNINVDKDSFISGSVFAGGATIGLDSEVRRNVFIAAASLNIKENAKIGKDLYYGTQENSGATNISDRAIILGSVHKKEAKLPNNEVRAIKTKFPEFLKAKNAVSILFSFLGALLVGVLYLKFFNNHFTNTSNLISRSPVKSTGMGFLIIVSIIPVTLILLITIIGAPIAGIAILIFLIFAYLAKLVVSLSLGNWLNKKLGWKLSVYKAFVIGAISIYIIKIIPKVGALASFIIFICGLGALAIQTFSKRYTSTGN